MSMRAQARERYRELKKVRAASEQAEEVLDLTARVRALYEDSAVPVREIAAMAGVTERTIYKYAAKQGWRPRYAWTPDGARPASARRRGDDGGGDRPPSGFAPVKGAGGRFIRREDRDKPFAQGLKASDPVGARRAAAQCADAALRARAAQKEVEREQRYRELLRAMDLMGRTADQLKAHREQRRAQKPAPQAAGTDNYARVLTATLNAAIDWWAEVMAEERAAREPA